MHPIVQPDLFTNPETTLNIRLKNKTRTELIAATNAILIRNGHTTLAHQYVKGTQGLHGEQLTQHTKQYVNLT